MSKKQKAILIILMMIFFAFNLSVLIDMCYEAIPFPNIVKSIIYLSIPFLILSFYYFISTRHIGKLLINRTYLFISLLSFIAIFICKILYHSSIISENLYTLSSLFYISYSIFAYFSFADNFEIDSKYPSDFILALTVSLVFEIPQLLFFIFLY